MLDLDYCKEVSVYYSTHSLKSTLDTYNIDYQKFATIMDVLKDLRCSNKPQYSTRCQEWKQEVVEFCHNNTRFEAREHFRTSIQIIDKVLKEFNIQRRTHAEELELIQIRDYGSVENYKNHIASKIKETSYSKYGVPNFAKSDLFTFKSKTTCQEKYGVDNPMQNLSIKEKCLNSRSTDYASRAIHSKPNRKFSKCLDNNEINYSIEYCLEGKLFDFLLIDYNLLVEINPTPTHSTSFNIWDKTCGTVDKYYHINKSRLAWKNGYRCLHVWDWDSFDDVIDTLLNNQDIYVNTNDLSKSLKIHEIDKTVQLNRHIYNQITKEHFIDNDFKQQCDQHWIELYDCGYIV